MPLYDYRCEHCDEHFEVIRRSTDKDKVECPKCSRPAKKQLSGFAIGSGSSSKPASRGSTSSGCGGWSGG